MTLDQILSALTLRCSGNLNEKEQLQLDDTLVAFIDRRSIESAATLVANATYWDREKFPATLQKAYFDIENKNKVAAELQAATEMLDAIGLPDWRYEDGSGIAQVNITPKQLKRWCKALNTPLPEEMPESHLD